MDYLAPEIIKDGGTVVVMAATVWIILTKYMPKLLDQLREMQTTQNASFERMQTEQRTAFERILELQRGQFLRELEHHRESLASLSEGIQANTTAILNAFGPPAPPKE